MRNATTVAAAGIGAMLLGIALLGTMTAPVQAATAPSPSPSPSEVSVSVVIPGPPTPTQIPPTPTQIPPNGNGNGRGPGNSTPGGPNGKPQTEADGSPVTPGSPTEGADPLTLDRDSHTANGLVTMTAVGYAPGEKVKVVLYSEPIVIGTYVADVSGNLKAQFRIPRDLRPGRHVVEATGWDSRHVTNSEFTLVTVAAAAAGEIVNRWWAAIVLGALLVALVSAGIYFRRPIRGWLGALQPARSAP